MRITNRKRLKHTPSLVNHHKILVKVVLYYGGSLKSKSPLFVISPSNINRFWTLFHWHVHL